MTAQFSRSGRTKRGLWRENVRARLGPFHLNWPEPVLFDRSEWRNGKRAQSQVVMSHKRFSVCYILKRNISILRTIFY